MRRLTSMGFSVTLNPATSAVPSVGGMKQVSMRMVVVFPAPLGPRKPTIWPFSTSNDRWSTATFRAYRLVSPWTLIIKVTQDEFDDGRTDPPYHRGTGPKLSITCPSAMLFSRKGFYASRWTVSGENAGMQMATYSAPCGVL